MQIATAYIELRIDRKNAEKDAKDAATSIRQSFTDLFKAAAFTKGMQEAVSAASNLQQAAGATEAVFGTASKAVDDFAKTSAESFGISERGARELTAQLGALLKGFGFTRDEAAASSVEIAKIGADLSAAFGGKPEEAVAALGGALRGEFDPLERFGVSLTAASVAAKAVELGLAKSTSTVDAHSKATAALALIQEQSADVAGQFGREINTAAGQQAVATAKAEDAAASFGEVLLPIYTRVVKVVGDVAGVFGDLPAPVQTAVVAMAGLLFLSGPIGTLVGVFKDLSGAIAKVGISAGTQMSALALLAVPIAAMSLRAKELAKSNQEMIDSFAELGRATDAELFNEFALSLGKAAIAGEDTDSALTKLAETNLEAAKRVYEYGRAQQEAGQLTSDQVAVIDQLGTAIVAEDTARANQKATIDEHTAALDTNTESTVNAAAASREQTSVIETAAEATRENAKTAAAAATTQKAASDKITEAFGRNSDAADNVLQSIRDLYDEMLGQVDTQRAYERSVDDSEEALATYVETLKSHKKTSEEATDAARDTADQLIDTAKAYAASKGAADGSKTSIDLMIQSLFVQATKLSEGDPLRQNLLAYIAELQKIPASIDTQINLSVTGKTVTSDGRIVGIGTPKLGQAPVKSAAGRYVPAGSNLLTTVAEPGAGAEVILPLKDRNRLVELLGMPQVAGPIADALGADGGAAGGSSGSSGGMRSSAPIYIVVEGTPLRAVVAARDQELIYDVLAGAR